MAASVNHTLKTAQYNFRGNPLVRLGRSDLVGEIRLLTASKGLATSTTAQLVQIPDTTSKYVGLRIEPNTFSTAVVVRYLLNPYLAVLKTTDNLAAVANTTDYSVAAQDGTTATKVTLNSLSTAAALDFLYIGGTRQFRGVSVDVQSTNSTASVLTVKAWDGAAWTDVTATDNTASGGASLAVDGTIVWTVPTVWPAASLNAISGVLLTTNDGAIPYAGIPLYWTRFEFSGGLDSTTDCNSILALNRSTAYAEMATAMVQEHTVYKGIQQLQDGAGVMGTGCIEALTDAGTALTLVTAFTEPGDAFTT